MSLTSLNQSCLDALLIIQQQQQQQQRSDQPLHIILKDLDALLALVYNAATKLALALPSDPTAATPILDDLARYPPALAHCTRLLHDDIHGETLIKDIKNRTREIIDALRQLVQSFLDGTPRDEDLVRTAKLHDLIASARSQSGIPRDNQTAVYRAWNSDRESLEDNLNEIASMIKGAQSDHHSDDGWDDIGLGLTSKMDDLELARANNVHHLLRLTTLLHKRVLLDILAHPSSAPSPAFDRLLPQSNHLLTTSDELVAALYTPHDTEYIRAQIRDIANITTSLNTHLSLFLPVTDQLVDQLRSVNISGAPTKKRADKKWFDTCVDQIICLSSKS